MHILAARRVLDTQPNVLLPSGINSENLQVRVRRVDRYTFTLTARLNAGGFAYNTRIPSCASRGGLRATPCPGRPSTRYRTSLFRSLNNFLNGIANTSSTGTGMTS